MRSGILIAVAIAALCGGARAQEAPALEPAAYRVGVGEPVSLKVRNVVTGADIPWDDARISWTLLRVAGTQENSDLAPRADEKGVAGSIRINSEGAAVIGVDFRPRVVTIEAADLRRFAHDRAGAELPESVKGAVAVRLVESVKTVVRTNGAGDERSGNVTEKTGQLVEIRPLFDPSAMAIGSDIPVVTYAGGGRAKNARVIATHIASGEKQEVRTNSSAIGQFRLSKAGVWRVEFHQLEPAPKAEPGANVPEGPQPTWVVLSATLMFETMGAAKPAAKEAAK